MRYLIKSHGYKVEVETDGFTGWREGTAESDKLAARIESRLDRQAEKSVAALWADDMKFQKAVNDSPQRGGSKLQDLADSELVRLARNYGNPNLVSVSAVALPLVEPEPTFTAKERTKREAVLIWLAKRGKHGGKNSILRRNKRLSYSIEGDQKPKNTEPCFPATDDEMDDIISDLIASGLVDLKSFVDYSINTGDPQDQLQYSIRTNDAGMEWLYREGF